MSSSVPVNVLIWMSVKPLIKLIIPAGAGVLLAKAGMLPVAGSRACSQIILNITLPSLLFSKVIASFTNDNISALGPIFLVGIIYMLVSGVLGLIIRATCRVPGNFRWGLLSAAIWSNWGDLPTAVVGSVCAGAPFVEGQAAADLAIAYVAIFILLFYVTLFPLRGTWLIQADYTHPPRESSSSDCGSESEAEKGRSVNGGQGLQRRVKQSLSALRRRKVGSGLSRRQDEAINAHRATKLDEKVPDEHGGDSVVAPELARPAEAPVTLPSRRTRSASASRRTGFSELHRTTTSRSTNRSVRELAGAAAAAAPDDTHRDATASTSCGQRRKDSRSGSGTFGRHQLRLALDERDRERERDLKTIVGSPAGSVFEKDDDERDRMRQWEDYEVDGENRTAVGSVLVTDDLREAPLSGPGVGDAGRTTPSTACVATTDDETRGRDAEDASSSPSLRPSRSTARRVLSGVLGFLRSLATPPTVSLITALVCALVTKLKALFIVVPSSNFSPTAPDGAPPLAIILDTATFLGNASVPLGLLVLGSALARMSIPKPISRLPFSSIVSLAVAKLVVLPVVGFFVVQGITKAGLVDKDNHVLRFVLIYFSCVPTATTQVALTQIFAPEDGESNSDVLASYILLQYMIFVVSSVVLTAVTLSSIF